MQTEAKRIEEILGKGRLSTSDFKGAQTQAKRIRESSGKIVFVLPIFKEQRLRQQDLKRDEQVLVLSYSCECHGCFGQFKSSLNTSLKINHRT